MCWICLSYEEMDALLHLVQRERENDFHGDTDDSDFESYLSWQKHMQELNEKLRSVLEHEK